MKLSIIIPFQKEIERLKDTLTGIEKQAFSDYEIILIGDRIEEDLTPIFTAYKEILPLVYYPLENGKGIAAARNLGLKKALGDYVYFHNSGDYLSGLALRAMDICAKETNSDIIVGKKEKGSLSQIDNSVLRENRIDSRLYTREELYPMFIPQGNKENQSFPISVVHMLIKRNLLSNARLLFLEDLSHYFDLPFQAALCELVDKVACAEGGVYLIRGQEEKKEPFEFLKAYKYAFQNTGEVDIAALHLQHYLCSYFIQLFMEGFYEEKTKELCQMYARELRELPNIVLKDYKGLIRQLLFALGHEKWKMALKIGQIIAMQEGKRESSYHKIPLGNILGILRK